MGHSGSVINSTGGVKMLADIQAVLGASSDHLKDLCLASNINKWAKFKPVRYNSVKALTEAQRASVNYGLAAPSTRTTPAATLSDTWGYNRPRGGSLNEWYRVLDFEGYNHNALPPCSSIGDIDIYLAQQTSFSFGGYIAHPAAGGDTITWSELPASIGGYYLCVVFSTGANLTGTLIAKTSVQTLSSSGIVLDLDQSELEALRAGGYQYYYLCGRSAALSTLTIPTSSSANYLALPTATSPSVDVYGAFTIHAAPVSNIIIATVSTVATPSRWQVFLSAEPYRGAESIDAGNDDYLLVGVNGLYYIHFGLDVTAGGTNLSLSSCAVTLRPTFYAPNGFTTPRSVTLRNSYFAEQTQITIPAGQTQRVYFVASVPLLSLNSSGQQQTGASNQHFDVTVNFYANSVLIATDNIRVRNGSIT